LPAGSTNRTNQPQNMTKNIRKPQQTAKLIKVSELRDRKTLVKHISPQFTTYWILFPSVNGSECQFVFVHRMKSKHMLPSDEPRIVRLAEIAVSPPSKSTLDGLDYSNLAFTMNNRNELILSF
jgi:hypothetical protein